MHLTSGCDITMSLNYLRKETRKENQKGLKSALDFFQHLQTLQEKEKNISERIYSKSLNRVYQKENASTEKQKIKVLEKLIKNEYKNRLNNKLQKITDAEDLLSKNIKIKEIRIEIGWNKNRIWGWNPSVEINIFTNDYRYNEHDLTGHASGCGYDKRSEATASAFNKSKILTAYLYKAKNKALKNNTRLNYGAGYGSLPYFEGAVGYSCHNRILTENLNLKNVCYEEFGSFDFYKYTA